jgi:membrane fusion protein, multidrug efflux system
MPALPRNHLIPIAVGGVTAVAVIVGGTFWWIEKQKYVATDNAFVAADKVAIAPQIDGYVAEVLVQDNEHVTPGQVLVRLESATNQARLAQAIANAQALEAAVRGVDDKAALEQAMIAQRAAGLDSAKAQSQFAGAEMTRYGTLAEKGWVTPT